MSHICFAMLLVYRMVTCIVWPLVPYDHVYRMATGALWLFALTADVGWELGSHLSLKALRKSLKKHTSLVQGTAKKLVSLCRCKLRRHVACSMCLLREHVISLKACDCEKGRHNCVGSLGACY